MNTIKNLAVASLMAMVTLTSTSLMAQTTVAAKDAELSSGEVKKIDLQAQKITLKHGELKNLDMPGMTMIFKATNPSLLDKVKAGDKVRFKAEKAGGAIVVTEILLNFDDDLLGSGIRDVAVDSVNAKPRDTSSIKARPRIVSVVDVEKTVVGEIRIECQAQQPLFVTIIVNR